MLKKSSVIDPKLSCLVIDHFAVNMSAIDRMSQAGICDCV